MSITRGEILEGKMERQQLELKVHWALCDLSEYFKRRNSPLLYRVNRLMHEFDVIRTFNIEADERGV